MGRLLRIQLAFTAVVGLSVLVAACSEIRRLELRCMGGDLQRCKVLGDLYLGGSRVPRDLAKSAEAYRRACDGGLLDVCNTLGEMYEHLPGFDVQPRQIADLYERACNGHIPGGCLNLGLTLAGQGELERAAELFDHACTAGLGAGCHYLATACERGEGLTKDVARAITLYEEACTLEYVDSCLALAALFTDGENLPPDATRAVGYLSRALKVYADACEAGSERDCSERDRLRVRIAIQSKDGAGR